MNIRQARAELARELSNFSLQPHVETGRDLSIKRATAAVAELRGVLAESSKVQALRELNRSLEAFDLSSTSGINVKRTPDKNSISGYGAIFGTLDADNEIIDRGAFASSLAQSRRSRKPILMLWQHDTTAVIGVWGSIVEDAKGLLCTGYLLPTVQRGAEALALLAAKAIGDLSIGFKTVRATRINGVRHIQEVRLFEVSLVSFASNSEACVTESANDEARSCPARPGLRRFHYRRV
jgi:HK97 family phage prohead protease